MNKNLTNRNQSRGAGHWSHLRDEMWDLIDRFSQDMDMPQLNAQEFTPRIEVKDLDKSYQVCAEIPGMSEKDINVSMKDNSLIIEGERRNETKNEDKKKGTFHSEFSYGRFYRTIPLGDDVDIEQVRASYQDGVLTVDLGKRADMNKKSRKIDITTGKSQSGPARH